ncbi:MAG: aldehyde dehydrogenase [Steroidobacteraceae bacterium]
MNNTNRYQMFIDGAWCDATGGKSFDTINPATAKPWAQAPDATAEDVNRAVEAARRAVRSGPWASTTATARGKFLRKIGDLLAGKSEVLGKTETTDTGKMLKETRWQAGYIAEYFHFYAGLADKLHGETLPIDKPDLMVMTTREPLGVVAAVVPWNSQLFLTAVKMAPALAAGNTIILKASEHAPAAMLEFGHVIEESGLPAGVVNIISGLAEPCGRALTSHPDIDRISFTGGPATARHIIRNSAENLAEVSLELGGKSPVVVFEDADLESAVNGVVAGIFGASGQSCVAGSRLLLHASIADAFLERLVKIAEKIRIGDPMEEDTQMGPLATLGQLERIQREVAGAVAQGARVLCGGSRPTGLGDGWYFQPTVIECPSPETTILDTELFGPVLSVLRFTSEAEAIELANQSSYGLAAGIFTRDGARALRMTKAIRAGIVWVNTYRMVSPIAEFGGFGHSGYGRESGAQAIYDYTRSKTVWLNTSSTPIANPFVMR